MKNKTKFTGVIKKNKMKFTLLAALVLCIGAYLITGEILNSRNTNDDIPLHDGDVLVDSINEESSLVASDDVVEPENSDTYFKELRATLDMDRNKIISLLSEEEKDKLLEYMEQEKTAETLIKNKGLPECFVVISDSGVNVTVNTEKLDQSTVTKICEIIMRQTGRPATEIVVQDVS